MKELKPHQQRLIVEHDELKAKIEGLEKFIVESPIFLFEGAGHSHSDARKKK